MFGRFELQPAERRLLVDGEPVAVGPRAFDVLVTLVERAGCLVTKDELLELVWPDLVVEENNLQVQISALRKLLGSETIVTVQGRGYRFTSAPQRVTVELPSSPEVRKHNLPRQLTSFIGREKEIAEIAALLGRTQLLTLTGAGGCGKTRLSMQVVAASLEQFPDGAWFVELAPLVNADLVPQTVAAVVGVKETLGKSITQTLTEHLELKRLLLVLDNCEHLLDGCAKVADAVMRECPDVKIVATSREALGIAGEQTYRVPSLTLPDRNEVPTLQTLSVYESVRLFIDRALQVRSDFEVTNHSAPALASLCHHLEGIPLAIELAAARVRSLSVEEIDGKLDQRFRLLTGGSRTALPRHQTLRSLIDWSYDLLNDTERLLLQRLSVFAGGCTLEPVERICTGEGVEQQQVLDLICSLADKNLVAAEDVDGHSRYRLLETVRQYARERLLERAASEAVWERHRDYYLAQAEESRSKLMGAEQAEWLQRLEAEHENLRSSLNWSLLNEAGSAGGLRLCGALWRFWMMRGYLSEGREWCRRVLGKTGAGERTLERARALHAGGVLAFWQADYPAAIALHEESLEISRELGDLGGIAGALNNLGNVASHQGDFASGQAFYKDSLAIGRELGDRWRIAASLNNLGILASEQGDFVSARALYEECLAIWRELGDRYSIANSLGSVGDMACYQGDYPAARVLYQEGLATMRDLGDTLGIVFALEGLAEVVAALGDPLRAACIWGATERQRAKIGAPPPPNRSRHEGRVGAARAALKDDPAFDRAWQEGRALTIEQAIELALGESVPCADPRHD